jgi:superfamily I DNA and/or RNA helicase
MATSSPDDAPRTMDFLYSRHRLNVAISRARAVAVLICSPDLLRVTCRTPEQMRLANALCRFVEIAGDRALLSVGPQAGNVHLARV